MAKSKSEERHLEVPRETSEGTKLQKFYFPDVGTGVTIRAATREEAEAQVAAIADGASKPGVPSAEDSQ